MSNLPALCASISSPFYVLCETNGRMKYTKDSDKNRKCNSKNFCTLANAHTRTHTPADTDRDGYEERQRNPWAERKAACVCAMLAKIYSHTTTIIKLYNFIIHFQFALLSSHLYKCNLPLHSIISWISFKFESSINFP